MVRRNYTGSYGDGLPQRPGPTARSPENLARYANITGSYGPPRNQLPTNIDPNLAAEFQRNRVSVGDVRNSRGMGWARDWAQNQYADQGYRLEARPYEFDESRFSNPYYDSNHDMLSAGMNGVRGRQDPFGSRKLQGNFADYLLQQYRGDGPSLAESKFRGNLDQNIKATMAMANTGRGNRGLAMRTAQYQLGDMNSQAANEVAQIRSTEQMNAGNLLGQTYQGMRSADLEQGRMNDAMTQYYTSQGLSLDQAQWAAQMELQKMKGEQHSTAQATLNKIGSQGGSHPGFWERLGGGLLNAGATLGAAALSDRRLKTKITKAPKRDIEDFISKINAYRYKYRDSKHGEGHYYSTMAQELERTKVGKSMVIDTPQGKMVDYGKGFGALLASQKHLYEKVKDLEAAK